jgi:hypothetical protein
VRADGQNGRRALIDCERLGGLGGGVAQHAQTACIHTQTRKHSKKRLRFEGGRDNNMGLALFGCKGAAGLRRARPPKSAKRSGEGEHVYMYMCVYTYMISFVNLDWSKRAATGRPEREGRWGPKRAEGGGGGKRGGRGGEDCTKQRGVARHLRAR